jgi:hypothetical protein
LGGNGAAVVLGLIAALWLPSRVPDTGSAATIVAICCCGSWVEDWR